MRKFIGFLLAVGLLFAFSAPVFAADKTVEERVKALEDTVGTWSFYGSARFATFYETSDKNFNDSYGMTDLSGADSNTTRWGIAGNSRIGAKVKKGDFGGRVELGLKENQGIGTRLIYGTYSFNDVTVLFGQDYAPLGDWGNSNQVFSWDNDLAGFGIMDENRVPQIKISFKGLQVALVENIGANTCGLPGADGTTVLESKTEVLMPHLELKYSLATDKFFGDVFGGFNTYKVKFEDTSTKFDKTVNAYALGVNGGVTLSPVYANAMVWMARNGKQLGLNQANAAGALIDAATGDITNDKDLGFALVAGANIQKITVEVGYGYVQSKLDEGGAKKDEAQSYYVQAVIPIAEGNGAKLSVTPEIGVIDYMKDATGAKQGKATYAGAKWQIDF
jgi:hypothetical protein